MIQSVLTSTSWSITGAVQLNQGKQISPFRLRGFCANTSARCTIASCDFSVKTATHGVCGMCGSVWGHWRCVIFGFAARSTWIYVLWQCLDSTLSAKGSQLCHFDEAQLSPQAWCWKAFSHCWSWSVHEEKSPPWIVLLSRHFLNQCFMRALRGLSDGNPPRLMFALIFLTDVITCSFTWHKWHKLARNSLCHIYVSGLQWLVLTWELKTNKYSSYCTSAES